MANKNPKQTKEFLENKGKIREKAKQYNETVGKALGKTAAQKGAEISNIKQKEYRTIKSIMMEEGSRNDFNLNLFKQWQAQLSSGKEIPNKDIENYFNTCAKITGELNDNQVVVNNNYNKLTREDIEEFDEMFENNLKDNNEKGTT